MTPYNTIGSDVVPIGSPSIRAEPDEAVTIHVDGHRAEMRRGQRVLAAVSRSAAAFTCLAVGQGPGRLLTDAPTRSCGDVLRTRMAQVARMLDDPDDAAAVVWEIIDDEERTRVTNLAGPGRSSSDVRLLAYGMWRCGRLNIAVPQRCDGPVDPWRWQGGSAA